MKTRWHALSSQEKRTVTVGGFAAAFLLFYFLIWSPLNNAVINLRQQIPQDLQTLTWMQTAEQRIQLLQKLSEQHHTSSTVSLLGTIQKQLKNSLLEKQVTLLQQTDNNTVHLTLQKTDFDALITWLTTLWQQQGVLVSQISVVPNGAPGVVNADIFLN